MDKKYRNWLGYVSIAIYILVFLFLLLSGLFLYNIGRFSIGKILFCLSLLWFFVMLPVTWIIVNNSRINMLPILKIEVKVNKKGTISTIRNVARIATNKINPTITFELPDNRLITFIVPINLFNSVFENETGTLTYKEQGKHIYFINFEPDSPKDGAY